MVAKLVNHYYLHKTVIIMVSSGQSPLHRYSCICYTRKLGGGNTIIDLVQRYEALCLENEVDHGVTATTMEKNGHLTNTLTRRAVYNF